uniref:Uncharacterized protein n=1 Tax=Plectus sambesii TaxID=2011161 RepID=A0A914XB76_9BILA
MLSLTFLIGVFICAVVPVVTTVTDAPVTTPALFQGLVSHQRSMLSSRWLTLATPWFIVNDKTLSKEERHARVKDLGQSIDKLIAALTCDQLTVAENMGMVQVYLILTRFFKKYPSAHNELAVHVPDINQVGKTSTLPYYDP